MQIDIMAMVWYAAICGGIALIAPTLHSRLARAVAGVAVGIIAAGLLPVLRQMIGG